MGATPVFYIANDAMTDYQRGVDWAANIMPAGRYSREFFLNSLISAFYAKRLELFFLLVKQTQQNAPAEQQLDPHVIQLLTEIEVLMRGVDREFLSYCVPFRVSTLEDAPDNFYMERE